MQLKNYGNSFGSQVGGNLGEKKRTKTRLGEERGKKKKRRDGRGARFRKRRGWWGCES